eukprot:gene27896-49624_t
MSLTTGRVFLTRSKTASSTPWSQGVTVAPATPRPDRVRERTGPHGLQDPHPLALKSALGRRRTVEQDLSPMKPIWIVDDDQSIRFVLEKALLREGLPTRSFTNPKEVLTALDLAGEGDGPQVLVSDIRMPGGSGLDLLDKVKARLPGLPVIIMTAYSDLDSAVSAFQGGAFEYLPKPFDLPRAVELIRRAQEESQREAGEQEAAAQVPEMLGQAPAMQDVFRAIGRLSQSNVTVMITGESGSGKELVARALHKHSPRGE